MRKAAGLFVALVLCIPVGVLAAGSAGAAATTLPTCTKLTGTVKYSPALPKIGNSTKVTSTSTSSLKITGCTGGGITSGVITGTAKYTGNCTTLLTPSTKPLLSTVKWSNGKTSSLSTTTKTTSKTGVTPILATLTSKITAGLGVGHTTIVPVKVIAAAGACTNIALTGYSLVNTGKFVTK